MTLTKSTFEGKIAGTVSNDSINNDGIDGIISNTLDIYDSGGSNTPYQNYYKLYNVDVEWDYITTDSLGYEYRYGTYDNSIQCSNFKQLGISFILLLFSFYLFFVATKIYNQYFKEFIIDALVYILAFSISAFWIFLVVAFKGIPFEFLFMEFILFPNQFVLGVILSSLLLLGVGIFRFTIIALVHNPENKENLTKNIRFSFVGFIFGIISLVANFLQIYSVFK